MDFAKILDLWEKKHSAFPVPKKAEDEAPLARAEPLDPQSLRIEDTLDLHGLKREEALENLKDFLRKASQEGTRKVLVVHGKGLHSEKGKPVLKTAVEQELRRLTFVETFGVAQRRDGGNGATWIVLKNLSARGK
jgi:DNA-nicking Smr family endonuclease